MKKVTKIIAVLLMAVIAVLPVTTAIPAAIEAQASPISPNDVGGLLEYLGIGDLSKMSEEELKALLDKIKSGDGLIGGFLDKYGIGEIIKTIEQYLGKFDEPAKKPETTTEAPTETTTEEPTTKRPEPPSPPPYVPPYVPVTPQPTVPAPTETTTFTYIPPEQIYTQPYTTTPFVPVVDENVPSDSSPFKTALGVALLLLSLVGVVVVAVKLKKSNI